MSHEPEYSEITPLPNPAVQRLRNEPNPYGPIQVNCIDPYDLRPAADVIVDEAIRRQRKAADRGRPFVLIMGERHTRLSDIALQQFICSRLIDENVDFGFSYEQPANFIGKKIEGLLSKDLSTEAKYRANDPAISGNDAGPLFSLTRHVSMFAPASRESLMAFCYYNRIPTIFNDAGKHERVIGQTTQYIDLEDPVLKAHKDSMPAHDRTWEVETKTDIGMAFRNHVMVQRSLSMPHDIIIQECGAGHAMGYRTDDSSMEFNTSLYSYYRNKADTLCVFPSVSSANLPREAAPAMSQAIFIEGLDKTNAATKDDHEVEAVVSVMIQEKEKLNKIFAASGGEIGYFEISSHRDYLKKEVKKRADEIVRRLEAA